MHVWGGGGGRPRECTQNSKKIKYFLGCVDFVDFWGSSRNWTDLVLAYGEPFGSKVNFSVKGGT